MKSILRWLPALLMMAVIFAFSATPGSDLPRFGLLDLIVKKGGHLLGFGLLALAFWFALRWEERSWRLALLLAVLYALTDEFHQSSVSGRHPSLVDALVIDACGAALALFLTWRLSKKR